VSAAFKDNSAFIYAIVSFSACLTGISGDLLLQLRL